MDVQLDGIALKPPSVESASETRQATRAAHNVLRSEGVDRIGQLPVGQLGWRGFSLGQAECHLTTPTSDGGEDGHANSVGGKVVRAA